MRLPEVIGQVLYDPKADQQKYDDYLGRFDQADVLWFTVSVQTKNIDDYEAQLNRSKQFLRKTLISHGRPRPLAIVITQLDGKFLSEGDARAEISEDTVREDLHTLSTLIEGASEVQEAALFPVSSFGFGNVEDDWWADLKDDGRAEDNNPDANPKTSNTASDLENWQKLKDGRIKPFNIEPLIIWSLLKSLQNKFIPGKNGSMEKQQLCDQLLSDLHALNGWFIPLKGE